MRSRRWGVGLAATGAVALVTVAAAVAAITPVSGTPAGATQVATAIAGPGANVVSASFIMNYPTAPANGTDNTPLGGFPTNGGTFGILTTGNVSLADDPNTAPDSGLDQNGGTTTDGTHLRGNTDYDTSILKVDLNVQPSANCLTFNFKFFSEEYPEWVNTTFNDAFIAELDSSTWTTSGSTITAPNNFAFDPVGNVISINAAGNTSMTAGNAAGTTYDGATPLLSASTAVTPGLHSLYLSIFDQGDQIFDSAVFLDNLRVGFVPNPAVNCRPGAQPVNFQMTLTPATDTNPVGTTHTVTATLTDDSGAPLAGRTIQFAATGANTAAGPGVTNGSGQATFTYTGHNLGDDTITACYNADNSADGSCEAVASATKKWVIGPPATLVLTPPADTNPVHAQHCVTATVRDVEGNPTPGIDVEFSVAGAGSGSGGVVTDASGMATFCYIGPTTPGADTITAYADTNGDGTREPTEPQGTATKTWVPGAPATLVLTPPTATNTVGDQHCVTAHVTDAFGNPVSAPVDFVVTGPASATPASATVTTDTSGNATFCFTGTDVGTDVITATVHIAMANPPSGTATKTFAPPAVDHYKCYDAHERKPDTPDRTVVLTDQFVTNGQARVKKLDGLCNPVSKNGEPIFQRDAHLTVYEIKGAKGFDVDKRVEVRNQFGTETFKVDKAKELLVPASKSEIPPATPGSNPGPPPLFTDHYLCYEVKGADKVRTGVNLVDQFGSDDVVVFKAKRLCNPVSKDGSRVLQPDVHLVCYELKKEENLKQWVNTNDQFGLSLLRIKKSALLCVPSTKRVL